MRFGHSCARRRPSGSTCIAGAVIVWITCFVAPPAHGRNIALSGFNADVVTEFGVAPFGYRFDGGTRNLPENGLPTGGQTSTVGLPSSRTFTSATGSGVTYVLQPYTGNNVLRLGDNQPATGRLGVDPGRYTALQILAASGVTAAGGTVRPGQLGDVTLHFTDGDVRLPKVLVAYDWYEQAAATTVNNRWDYAPVDRAVAFGRLWRNELGGESSSAVNPQPPEEIHGYALYETTIDLRRAGLSMRDLQGITFNAVNPKSVTNVFAVDGTPVPEPAAPGLLFLSSVLFLARRRGRTRL